MPQNFPTNRQNPNRKDESIRRANRVIQTRTFVLMLIMGIGMFFLLFFKLYNLQITRHEELQAKAVSQQTRSSVVTASRGAIYDASGNILAISSTAETIFLSPKEINDALNDEENPVAWTKEVLAAALAKILDVSEEGILKKMARTDSMYEVLKFRVEEDIADQVRQYINDNKVKGVYLTTDAKRYYPYGDLAAQVIGFVGVDYTGLFGLEAEYDKELQGRLRPCGDGQGQPAERPAVRVLPVLRPGERRRAAGDAGGHRAVLSGKGHEGHVRRLLARQRRHRHRAGRA